MISLKLGVFAQSARAFKDYERATLEQLPWVFETIGEEVEVTVRQCRSGRDITSDLTSVIFLPGWDAAIPLRTREEIQHRHALWAAASIAADS